MSAKCVQSTENHESNDDESHLEEAPEEEGAEEKMADTPSSASSNASFSLRAPSSASPALKTASPVAGAGASELVPEYSAPVDWQPEWNGLVVEPNGEYCMPGEFAGCSGAVVDMETPAMEPCYVPPAQVAPAATHLGPRFVPRPHVHTHPVCPGGALHHPPGTHSPHMHSPGTHSSGSSPYDNGASPAPQQYVVNVHVNPGETFSVRVGDEVQLIQGPATVRMVSNSGPPMPMPMQVPPGHMVQQIVDENGILTHVILSPQIPGVPTSPLMAAPNGTPPQMYPSYAPQYPTFPSHYVPHHHSIPPRHFHSMGPPHMHGTTPAPAPPHQCNQNHHAVFDTAGSVGPHGSQGAAVDLRAQKIKARLQEKVNKRKAANDGQQRNSVGECHSATSTNTASAPTTNDKSKSGSYSRDSSIDGQEFEEECKLVQELLSKMSPPEVTSIESRCALVRLTPPNVTSTDLDIDPSEFIYVLQLSDKKETNFKSVYSGGSVEVPLTKLLPATEYYIRAFCKLDDLHGDLVSSAAFRTLSAEPDAPFAPKLGSKSKTTIQLKWSAPADNGSKITSYLLEYDQGTRDLSKFVEIYNGPQKQFKVTKLAPSVGYVFRLAAVNAIGKSDYSDPVCHCTSGTVPSQTDPPMLSEQSVKALTISWIRRPSDDSFTLQMEDEATGHGFLTVYNGSDLSYKVVNLRRNTEYKFRLQASNDEGSSKWSDVVCYRTLPDRPGSPPKPQLKGRASSNSFKVIWDQSKDNGGMEISNYLLQLDDGSKKIHVTNEREFTAERLQPGFTYRIRVQAVGPGGTSDWSEVLLVTTQAICPGQCRQPRLHGRPKATYLTIMWDCPDYDGGSQVTEYAVMTINPDQTSREVYHGHDTECVVAGLQPGRTYGFQVKAFNKAGTGPWSDRLDVVTGAGLPDAPHQPDVHCKSPHMVVVSWDEPRNNGAPITEYRLEWQPKEDLDFVPLFCGTSLNYELSRLSPATRYAFRVQAVNSAGVGPFSTVATCLTPPSSPGAVVSLRANPTATSIQLSWKEPPCNGCRITSYNIDIGERQLISMENVTEHVIDNLVPETCYKIRIQAVNAIGVGAFSVPIKVTTRALPPNAPHLECASVGSKFVKLKWGDGKNTDLIQYCLEMMRDNGSFQPVYQGTAQTHKVTKLNEQSQYHFRIFATNEAGDGPVSDIFTCTTTKAPPGILKQPKVTEIGLNSCLVEWSALKPIGHDMFIYILQLQTITDKDQDYREVYRGAEQMYSVHGLLPKTSYQVHVCAIRKCKDGSDDLVGPFSPSSLFTTCSAKSPALVTESGATRVQSKLSSIRLTDQQWAILILLGFTLFAVVVAFAAKQIIERTGSVAASRSRN